MFIKETRFAISVPDAVKSIKLAWQTVRTTTIKNCFAYARFKLNGVSEDLTEWNQDREL